MSKDIRARMSHRRRTMARSRMTLAYTHGFLKNKISSLSSRRKREGNDVKPAQTGKAELMWRYLSTPIEKQLKTGTENADARKRQRV